MVSIETLHLAANDAVERSIVELDARVSAAIWDARNNGLKAVEVVGIYETEAFKDIEHRLMENRYDVLVSCSPSPIIETDGKTFRYFGRVKIEW